MMVVLTLIATRPLAASPGAIQDSGNWSSEFDLPGIDGAVMAFAVYGGELVVAGGFDEAGSLTVKNIARWNGARWASLGPGLDGDVIALCIYEGDLIAAGDFRRAGSTLVNHIARWDGSTWSTVGAGTDGVVKALTVHGTDLVVGGGFMRAGGIPARDIARWDGTTWHPLGAGVTDGGDYYPQVRKLISFRGDLIAAGFFREVDHILASHVARWDGSAWHPLGEGTNQWVLALEVLNDDLVVGGYFWYAGGQPASSVASWDGENWKPMSGLEGIYVNVETFAMYQGQLLAAGAFLQQNYIARWNGLSWEHFADGVGGSTVFALSAYDGHLYAGGQFAKMQNQTVNNITVYDGTTWSALTIGEGIDGDVEALATWEGEIVAGGLFGTCGERAAKSIASWNGARWSPLGAGIQGRVLALTEYQNELVAAGNFQVAGGSAANYIASWNGSQWRPLGQLNQYVTDLVVFQGQLVACGGFTEADGVPVQRIASWDGNHWKGLDLQMTSPYGAAFVQGLAVHQGALHVVGRFNSVNGVPAGNVARFDGASWTLLPSLDSEAEDLAVFGGSLYASGGFNTAGGIYAPEIARWDGRSWSAVGAPPQYDDPFITDPVYRLGAFDGGLVFSAKFDGIGGIRTPHLARWDGQAWHALESGLDAPAHAIFGAGRAFYAGGAFTRAGDNPSHHIARWDAALVDATSTSPRRAVLHAPGISYGDSPVQIRYSIGGGGTRTSLRVYGVRGELVRDLGTSWRDSGEYSALWDRRGATGGIAARGVYLVELRTRNESRSCKLILLGP